MTTYKESTTYPPVDKLWTSKDVAIYLQMTNEFSYQVVERWARSGLIKCGYAGDKPRFRKEDVDEYVFSRKR